jgi:hypothetical protein
MEIRIRQSGQVVYESEFRSLHPNTTFPQVLTTQVLNEAGADVVFEGPQATPTRYQTAYRNGVEQIGGKWYTKYSVADMDDEAKTALDSKQAESVRNERTKKLAETDWTQLTDAPVNSAAWGTYRQALRDVTSQAGFPWEVTWPTKPTAE